MQMNFLPLQDKYSVLVNFHRAVCALTSVLDFVGVDEILHGKRVACIAEAIARELKWPEEQLSFMFYAGMLHDCGISQTQEHRQLYDSLLWPGAEAHCRRGETYLADCPPLAEFAQAIRWHHTPWSQLQDEALDEAERLQANLLFLADRVDSLLAPRLRNQEIDMLVGKQDMIDAITLQRGSLFAPELADAFARLARQDAFWLALEAGYLLEYVEHYPLALPSGALSQSEVFALARLFARIVDAKSPYTCGHSPLVADLAGDILGLMGGDPEHRGLIEIAGLLHDIGKLRVPDWIIEKPATLSADERAILSRHSYHTYRILCRMFPNTPIAEWATGFRDTLHDHSLAGRQRDGGSDLETRIIAAAEIYQALSQARPHRPALDQAACLAHLRELAASGHLDPAVVACMATHQERLYLRATGQQAGELLD